MMGSLYRLEIRSDSIKGEFNSILADAGFKQAARIFHIDYPLLIVLGRLRAHLNATQKPTVTSKL